MHGCGAAQHPSSGQQGTSQKYQVLHQRWQAVQGKETHFKLVAVLLGNSLDSNAVTKQCNDVGTMKAEGFVMVIAVHAGIKQDLHREEAAPARRLAGRLRCCT